MLFCSHSAWVPSVARCTATSSLAHTNSTLYIFLHFRTPVHTGDQSQVQSGAAPGDAAAAGSGGRSRTAGGRERAAPRERPLCSY
eukprot:364686-Chlamydomonas_euryale.AAC.2